MKAECVRCQHWDHRSFLPDGDPPLTGFCRSRRHHKLISRDIGCRASWLITHHDDDCQFFHPTEEARRAEREAATDV